MKCEVKNGIYWVGAIDWNMRDFHGYDTPKGTSYNAYLIMDEKIALVDTVKGGFSEEMFLGIREYTDPGKIDCVIVNHLERTTRDPWRRSWRRRRARKFIARPGRRPAWRTSTGRSGPSTW